MSAGARWTARLKAYFCLAGITLACFVVILLLKLIDLKYEPGAWYTFLFVIPVPLAAKVGGRGLMGRRWAVQWGCG